MLLSRGGRKWLLFDQLRKVSERNRCWYFGSSLSSRREEGRRTFSLYTTLPRGESGFSHPRTCSSFAFTSSFRFTSSLPSQCIARVTVAATVAVATYYLPIFFLALQVAQLLQWALCAGKELISPVGRSVGRPASASRVIGPAAGTHEQVVRRPEPDEAKNKNEIISHFFPPLKKLFINNWFQSEFFTRE